MSDAETIARLQQAGIEVETVRDILDGEQPEEQFEPAPPFEAPRLEGTPPFPEPGIYFGMPEEVYHAIHAVSTSGLKRLSVSSMDYWADSVLNADRDLDEDGEEKEVKPHFDFGKAIHCFVLEGEDCYAARYVVGLDKRDYPNRLETTDEIKAEIVRLGHKPISRGFDNAERAAKKDDWIAQLLHLDPTACIWEDVQKQFRRMHEGAQFITARTDRRVRIAAKMVLGHPEIGPIVSSGYPEVSVFWYCRTTGVPMKARFDKLTMQEIVDLKSFGNRGGMPIDRAIERAIATYRYNLQHVIYDEAATEVKRMIREAPLMHPPISSEDDCTDKEHEARFNFAEEWARVPEHDFLFVFQQTGLAPVTRGRRMPRQEMGVFGTTRARAEILKRRWLANCEVYGTDPWLDIVPIDTIEDENIPLYATEI